MKEDSIPQVKHSPCGTRKVKLRWTKSSITARVFAITSLDDGIYDVIVIDASEDDDGAMKIELAISSGTRRGEVVTLNATNLGRSWSDVLASPATLTVTDGQPRLRFDA